MTFDEWNEMPRSVRKREADEAYAREVAAAREDRLMFEAEQLREAARLKLRRDDDFCATCGSTLTGKRCGECGSLAHGKLEHNLEEN